ncbi:hypothetical protein MPSEU_000075300 [Mayamaea pseudoterrestris]|nr:hypothetical protein MPSEU_000075300 [Mayamaea pseudoterrestris]
MGNIPPHMLDQIRQAQERAQVTDNEVQAGPSKKARLAFLQASKASDDMRKPAEIINAELAGLVCCFCEKSLAPMSKTDARAAKLNLPCRHAYHLDCQCAHWYQTMLNQQDESDNGESKVPAIPVERDESDCKCIACHQAVEQTQEFAAVNVPANTADAESKPSASNDPSADAPPAISNILESEDPSMHDILMDIRSKLWDSNHKVVSAALRMLVQIIHSDIESDAGSENDEDSDDDEEDKDDYSDLGLAIGLPVVLVHCLSRHGAEHADVPKMVLGVLEWLVSREEPACRIIPRIDNALLSIVESMQRNASDGSLQYLGLQVLNKLLTSETKLALNSAGIVGATFQAMQNNKENTLVQESALHFLNNFTTNSDFATQAVAGHDQTLRERHAQCLAGSLFCVSKDATNDPDSILACAQLILTVASLDHDFRAAMHKVAGAPIKQVFVNFGTNAQVKAAYRDVLKCLISKPAVAGPGPEKDADAQKVLAQPSEPAAAPPECDSKLPAATTLKPEA